MEEIKAKVDLTESDAAEAIEAGEITVLLSVAPVINYAMYCNGVKLVQSVTIKNNSKKDLSNLN